MCNPISSVPLPNGLKSCCDAVASFFLHDREHAEQKLFQDEVDVKFFQDRQKLLDSLKDSVRNGDTDKRTLDAWLWGKLQPKVIFDNGTLNTLISDLQSITGGESWSLQVLPASVTDIGHHVALGRSPNRTNWWMLDPASCLYIFNSLADLAKYAANVFANSEFNTNSRTVLLQVT